MSTDPGTGRSTRTGPDGDPRAARRHAAALFAAAALNDRLGADAQLHLHAAAGRLGGARGPVPLGCDAADPDDYITAGLRQLGALSLDEFATPDVLAAARHAHAARRAAWCGDTGR